MIKLYKSMFSNFVSEFIAQRYNASTSLRPKKGMGLRDVLREVDEFILPLSYYEHNSITTVLNSSSVQVQMISLPRSRARHRAL